MKKYITLIITIILFGFVTTKFDNKVYANYDTKSSISEFETLNEVASYSTTTYYDSFLQAYFDNLTYNFGKNYKGSCSYVALAMLLSYYDTYLNDEIIPEEYDIPLISTDYNMIAKRNSPGVLRDLINYSGQIDVGMSTAEYYSKILELSNTSLHAKLITLGKQMGYYDYNDLENPCGTTFHKMSYVLIAYLLSVTNYTTDDFTLDILNYELNVNQSNSDLVRNFTIEKIKQGIPVALAIKKSTSTSGHVVIAYDYDETTDEIYCHFGWESSDTHKTPESEGYSLYKSALTINFNVSHVHTNNYGITKNNVTTYYCYDSPYIETYKKHTHNYVNHNCTICNEYTDIHRYNTYTWINDMQHTAVCSCGEIKTSGHVVSGSSSIPGKEYGRCVQCGGKAKIGYIYIESLLNSNKYTIVNGQCILDNGIIVVFDDEKLKEYI